MPLNSFVPSASTLTRAVTAAGAGGALLLSPLSLPADSGGAEGHSSHASQAVAEPTVLTESTKKASHPYDAAKKTLEKAKTVLHDDAKKADVGELSDAVDALTVYPLASERTVHRLTTRTVEASAAVEKAAKKHDAEVARKEAAKKAAEQKVAEQKAAEQQAEQQEQSQQAPQTSFASSSTPGSAQSIARQMASSQYGWGDDQFQCLVNLWNRESGWNTHASNPSGAYGIPQALPGSKMSSAGPDWQNNASTQIAWGLGYISGSYGSPCAAWGHSQSSGWY